MRRGVMREPQPRPAAALRALYDGDDGIIVPEAAVDTERGSRSLPGIEMKIRELTVDSLTFDDVLDQLRSPRLDGLQIDSEGADLLSLFPFDRTKPAIVHRESKNKPVAEQDRTLDRLCALDYRISRSGTEDMLAVRTQSP